MNEKEYKKYKNAIKKYKSSLEKVELNVQKEFLETRYNSSFKISIDVSKLLKLYNSYLKKINTILTDINVENEKKINKYENLNNDLSTKIHNIQKELTINAKKLQSGLTEKKLSKNDVTHYNNLINRIKKDTSTLKL